MKTAARASTRNSPPHRSGTASKGRRPDLPADVHRHRLEVGRGEAGRRSDVDAITNLPGGSVRTDGGEIPKHEAAGRGGGVDLRALAGRHMPQTVTGARPDAGARRKSFSSHVRSGARSKTIRCPASAPQRSM